jgi:hypothetical protein
VESGDRGQFTASIPALISKARKKKPNPQTGQTMTARLIY